MLSHMAGSPCAYHAVSLQQLENGMVKLGDSEAKLAGVLLCSGLQPALPTAKPQASVAGAPPRKPSKMPEPTAVPTKSGPQAASTM